MTGGLLDVTACARKLRLNLANRPGRIKARHVKEGAVVIDIGASPMQRSDGTIRTVGAETDTGRLAAIAHAPPAQHAS